jgi:hypothetical protein
LWPQNCNIEWIRTRQGKRINEMRMTNWNVRISYRVEAMNEMVKGMCKYKTDVCVLF